ncbi:MAG: single-stranded-DNA-specific exonuclease RecJ [Pirellulaceae bacterium]|nr:single-stranded-DNA-specific exonuclease RecJ [Pirellulaceae bacterium]
MTKTWKICHHDLAKIAHLEKNLAIPAVVAQLLTARQLTDLEVARQFLNPKLSDLREPTDLPGVSQGVEVILRAIQEKKKVTIYGDYDADGMTSTAILYRCLELLGATVDYLIPNRLGEGYGLHRENLDQLAARGSDLVVTVDCGISDVDEVAYATKLGIEIIITDHHRVGPTIPEAAAVVHPALPGGGYPFDGLCGAGVAFKLAWALCQEVSGEKKVSPRMRNFLLEAVSLAMIGTVADVVPLLDENRALVKYGLSSILDQAPMGLQKLLIATKLDQKKGRLKTTDIGFGLAPLLNAAGRLGQAPLAVELLTTSNEARAEAITEYICQLNESRGTLERSVYREAHKQLQEKYNIEEAPAFVLSGKGWHSGVIGIVASRLVDKYGKPTFIVAQDKLGLKVGVGSGRAANGLNLYQALAACKDHLVSFGGHAAAAGFKIDDDKIEAFTQQFEEYLEELPGDQVAELTIDAEIAFGQLTHESIRQFDLLEPFGQGNKSPLFCAMGVELVGEPKTMGGGKRHFSAQFRQGNHTLRAIAFGRADWVEEMLKVGGTFDIAFRPTINEFRGQFNVEIRLEDWRKASHAAAVAG